MTDVYTLYVFIFHVRDSLCLNISFHTKPFNTKRNCQGLPEIVLYWHGIYYPTGKTCTHIWNDFVMAAVHGTLYTVTSVIVLVQLVRLSYNVCYD